MMIDLLILLFWLVCLIRGFFRGALKELFAMMVVPLALLAAAFGFSALSHRLPDWVGSSPLSCLMTFVIFFACGYLLMTTVSVIVSYLVRARRRGRLDRLLGAGLGAAKGMLVVSALLIPAIAFWPDPSLWIADSAIIPYEERMAEQLSAFLPSAIKGPFRAHREDYRRVWNRRSSLENEGEENLVGAIYCRTGCFFGVRRATATGPAGEYRDGVLMYPTTSTAGNPVLQTDGRLPTSRIPRVDRPPRSLST